jgi:hypothetical protein
MAKQWGVANLRKSASCNTRKGVKLEIVFGVSTLDKKGWFFVEYDGGSKFLEANSVVSADWGRKGGRGRWGMKTEAGDGAKRVITGLFGLESQEWDKEIEIEMVAKKGVIRGIGREGGGGKDVVSVRLGEIGYENVWMGIGTGVVMKAVDEAVVNWNVKRVICHGIDAGSKYVQQNGNSEWKVLTPECDISIARVLQGETIVLTRAHEIGLDKLEQIVTLLQDFHGVVVVILDTLAGPLPGQLGAPLLDYERFGCGWAPTSSVSTPDQPPVWSDAISNGYTRAEDGVNVLNHDAFTSASLQDVDEIVSPVGTRKDVTKWITQTNAKLRKAKRKKRTPRRAYCFVQNRDSRINRFVLYELRSRYDRVFVILPETGDARVKGKKWDATFCNLSHFLHP